MSTTPVSGSLHFPTVSELARLLDEVIPKTTTDAKKNKIIHFASTFFGDKPFTLLENENIIKNIAIIATIQIKIIVNDRSLTGEDLNNVLENIPESEVLLVAEIIKAALHNIASFPSSLKQEEN